MLFEVELFFWSNSRIFVFQQTNLSDFLEGPCLNLKKNVTAEPNVLLSQ